MASPKNKVSNVVASASPLQPIMDSVGSHIWIIMGHTSFNWLLLLTKMMVTKWQTQDRNAINIKLSRQLENCSDKCHYVTEVA